MSEKKVLYDIPTRLKEYHNIEYNPERNMYWIWGHHEGCMVSTPFAVPISSNAIMTESDSGIVHIEIGKTEITLYDYSIQFHFFEG